MASMTVLEDTPSVLRIGSGPEHRTSIRVLAFLGTGLMGLAVLFQQDLALTAACVVGAVVLGMVALMLHNQSRQLEWNFEERVLYVIGRQRADMCAIPFDDIACIRLTKRRIARSLTGAATQGQAGENPRGRERFHLEAAMRDTGYEGIDHSFTLDEVRQLSAILVDRTGLPFCDEIDGSRNRPAAHQAVTSRVLPPEQPSPGSVLRLIEGEVRWPLSPGWPAISVMLIVLLSLMAGASSTYVNMQSESNADPMLMVIALGVAFFFMVIVTGRLAHAFLGRGQIVVKDGVLRRDLFSPMGNRSLEIPVQDILALRVIAPRFAMCQLQILNRTGQAAVIATVSTGVTPLTVGDLYWLRGVLNRKLQLQQTVQGDKVRHDVHDSNSGSSAG